MSGQLKGGLVWGGRRKVPSQVEPRSQQPPSHVTTVEEIKTITGEETAAILDLNLNGNVIDLTESDRDESSPQFEATPVALAGLSSTSTAHPDQFPLSKHDSPSVFNGAPVPLDGEPRSGLSHPFRLRCAYNQHHGSHADYVTTCHGGGREAVDYLLIGGFKDTQFGYRRRVFGWATEYVEPPLARDIKLMPNSRAPSDHIPLIAKFEIITSDIDPLTAVTKGP
ncbi:hypothetical protein HDU93_002727 [Gonapodya sp. JEL0774]|nr:hypothetical protein HDU93_002727 [Gonapodya sp. JEL0774]